MEEFLHTTTTIIIIILLVVISIIYFFQFKYFKKQNTDLVILQKDKPDKELIEDMIDNRSPTIFTGLIEDWKVEDDKNITKEEYDSNTKISISQGLNARINQQSKCWNLSHSL